MPYTVTVTKPSLPKKHAINIPKLGVFLNGEETELSDEAAASFKTATGKSVEDSFKKNKSINVNKSKASSEGGDN